MLSQLITSTLKPNIAINVTEEIPLVRTKPISNYLNSSQSTLEAIQHNLQPSLITLDSSLLRDLKKTPLLNLLEETPTIRQLFSTDFKNLVSDLLEIQTRKSNIDENNFQNLHEDEIYKKLNSQIQLDQYQSNEIDHQGITKDQMIYNDSLAANSMQIERESSQANPDYNHLLHQEASKNQNSQNMFKRNTQLPRKHLSQETKPQPYDDKKKSKEDLNLAKNLIKTAAKALNTLSLKLNNLAN